MAPPASAMLVVDAAVSP
ncbi:hypothetical protein Tco_0887196, partial [Tanacetum coccineum]